MDSVTKFICSLKKYLNIMNIFKKSYNDESDEWYFLEVDVQYLENLHNYYNDLLFLAEKNIEQVEKLAANLHNKTKYVNCKII